MSNSIPNVNSLFQSARDEGLLSAASMQALSLVDPGAQIQYALGVPALDVQASEVVLVTVMPDDSGSIRFAGNSDAVRQGHNSVIDALALSKQKDTIQFHTRFLNGYILYPFGPLDLAVRLDQHNYDPMMGTPLYDQSVALLATVMAKTQEFRDNGIPVRTVTLLVTDGNDESSHKQTSRSVKALVKDMLMAENHIVAAMGIDDGGTDFKLVFREMGIPDQWILTPGNTPSEIRRAFQVFSQSAVRASQTARTFSQTAMGGFGNP